MSTVKLLPLVGSELTEDAHDLLDAQWDERTLPSHRTEAPALDTESVTDVLHGLDTYAQVPGDVLGVDTRRVPLPRIHNAFFIPGKVPSLNELLEAKSTGASSVRSIIMRVAPKKGKRRGNRSYLYNDIKQDWKARTIRALPGNFERVEACYFGYVIVEQTLKRDPSNISSAAIKFIEDALVKAGVIANDGWKQVKGIRSAPIHRPGRDPGIFVVMSADRIHENDLVVLYEAHFKANP